MKHEFDQVIRGEFITLKKVTINDAPYIFRWRSSSAGQYLNRPKNYSLEAQINWIESCKDTEINYIILNKDGKRVGMIGIYDVDWVNGVSNCGRLILDEQYVHQHTPYGIEALLLGYDYVFNKMGMRKISGTILGLNTSMIGLQRYLGMTDEGLWKRHVLINGNYEDLCVMSLFRDDFGGYKQNINNILDKFRK